MLELPHKGAANSVKITGACDMVSQVNGCKGFRDGARCRIAVLAALLQAAHVVPLWVAAVVSALARAELVLHAACSR